MEISTQDKKQLSDRGISEAKFQEQLAIFAKGLPYAKLVAPCTLGHGIRQLNSAQVKDYGELFAKTQAEGRCTKFVPASGAASRMFKELLAYYHSQAGAPVEASVQEFFAKLPRFAFYNSLNQALETKGKSIPLLMGAKQYREILQALLDEGGLHYEKMPKGLIEFHRYTEAVRTAFAEHLIEALAYVQDEHKTCRLHLTISPEHQEKFQQHFDQIAPSLQKDGARFAMEFSFQSPATDTVAVDLDNQPFRGAKGNILFRPGGHGALIKNLNELKGDIVLIKNIDNVVVDAWKPTTVEYKKALGGILVELQKQIFQYLERLESSEVSQDELAQMRTFVLEQLGAQPTDEVLGKSSDSIEKQIKKLTKILHRPLRVCGMVKNDGAAGGGPFWLQEENGSVSCQIVESAQVDLENEEQKAIFHQSTHFNPVDLVCGLKDHRGKSYDLSEFVDPQAGFISQKSKEGRELKALELPGLWNGAMAFWNTVFVEVPLETFNPVKSVNDLLKKAHQV